MRKVLTYVACIGSALVLSGSLALAQDEGKAEAAFKKLDKNSDGKVSLEEFKESAKDAGKAEDGDGNLSLEEFKAAAGKKKDK